MSDTTLSETMQPKNTVETAAHAVVSAEASGRRNANVGAAVHALNIVQKQPPVSSPSADALAPGIGPTPTHNLVFRGGKTIRNLTYQNLFVGGQAAWAASDIQNIDRALAAAMTDARLNMVINQYFNNQAVSTTPAPLQILPGPKPRTVSRASVSALVRKHVVNSGLLNRFDAATTVFNFLLPPGVILTTTGGSSAQAEEENTDAPTVTTVTTIRAGNAVTTVTVSTATIGNSSAPDKEHPEGGPLGGNPDDAASSLNGLGGYHGSIHVGGTVVYFAVAVFSEQLPNGSENGIDAFPQSWKNVVGTLYHELQEARTDPDVEDAIRTQNDNFIGWNSNQGEEIGDFPVFEANPLQQVFREVPLQAGGTAPIQLMYSNRVSGPEDPTV